MGKSATWRNGKQISNNSGTFPNNIGHMIFFVSAQTVSLGNKMNGSVI